LFISNVLPKGGEFTVREKILLSDQISDPQAIVNAPTIFGSVQSINLINGGEKFNIGDIIKVTHRDVHRGGEIRSNKILSRGRDAKFRITKITSSQGTIPFDIERGGFGFTNQANTFVYNGEGDTTGISASFELGQLSYIKHIPYNTDLIVDFRDITLNAVSFGFPYPHGQANISSTIKSALSYNTDVFGTIAVLDNIDTGEYYTNSVFTFTRSTQLASNTLPGTITYSTTSNTITGVGTMFQGNNDIIFFAANDVIYLQANTDDSATIEYQIIKSVDSNTHITLYGPPTCNSTDLSIYKNASVILPANFGVHSITAYDQYIMDRPDGTINGKNEIINGYPSIGNNVVADLTAIDSGRGYADSERIYAYLYRGLSVIEVIDGGTGYANGDHLIFTGGDTVTPAYGYVTTDETGVITAAVMDYSGSNYKSVPLITVRSKNGKGANLYTEVTEFDTYSKIYGTAIKGGIGRKEGYWSTTRGFLNSNKYIQDSYFYQDYSYQIKAASTLDKYKSILYDTFHVAGSELFGEFYIKIQESSLSELKRDPTTTSPYIKYPVSDTTFITSDDKLISVDQIGAIF
jgi:hypothetical protein